MLKFLGVVLLIVGIILEFVRRGNTARLLSLKSANLTSVQDLLAISRHIAQEIGSGSLQEYVKVRGRVNCAEPLLSELKREPCVYYRMSVTRVYEALVTKVDETGKQLEKAERREECVASNTRMTPFQLDDGTGMVQVDPEGGEVETVKVMSEFRDRQSDDLSADLGQALRNLISADQRGHSTTLGYRYEESVLPVGREILVLGTAVDQGEKVTLRKPTQPDKKFLISFQDEAVLADQALRVARGAKWGMVFCLGAGALLTLVGVVTGG